MERGDGLDESDGTLALGVVWVTEEERVSEMDGKRPPSTREGRRLCMDVIFPVRNRRQRRRRAELKM